MYAVTDDGGIWESLQDRSSGHWYPWSRFREKISPPPGRPTDIFASEQDKGLAEQWVTLADGRLFTTWFHAAKWVDFCAEVGSLPALAGPAVGAPLADGHLELFVRGVAGGIWTTWKTGGPSSAWAPWVDFLVEVPPPFSGPVRSMAVTPLADGRLILWVVTAIGQVFATWKVGGPNSAWSPWTNFLAEVSPPFSGSVRAITAVPLQDRHVEVFVAVDGGEVWTTWQSGGANSPWVPWADLLAETGPLPVDDATCGFDRPLVRTDNRVKVVVSATNTGTTTWRKQAHAIVPTSGGGAAGRSVIPADVVPGGSIDVAFSCTLMPPANSLAVGVQRESRPPFGRSPRETVQLLTPATLCHYRVQPGDTYVIIAQRLFGDARWAGAIQDSNGGNTTLISGGSVVVPWAAGEYRYTVPNGGSFWAAARAAYGTATNANVATIITWNGGDARRVLRPGDLLCCPKGVR